MEIKLLLSGINGSLHETSLFFVLPTYVEIILSRWLHDPIVTKLCQNPWNRLYTLFHLSWTTINVSGSHLRMVLNLCHFLSLTTLIIRTFKLFYNLVTICKGN